jgi:hypothetical protein
VTPPDTDGLTGRLLTLMGIGGTVTGVGRGVDALTWSAAPPLVIR